MTKPEVRKTTNHKAPQAYKGNGNHEWEDVAPATQRLRVPGGWIYATWSHSGLAGTTFVPTPVHVI